MASPNAPAWARKAHAGVFSSTRRQFATALAASPDGTAAQAMYRAMLMVFEGDVDEAVRRLRLALQRPLALEERAYVSDLLIDALIESGRLDEAQIECDIAPDFAETLPLLAAHRARVFSGDSRPRRSMAVQYALRHALSDSERSGALVLYRLADAAVRSGDFRGAEVYMKAFNAKHARSHERLRALSLDLRANIRFREGLYESSMEFAQEALAIAARLEERSLIARHAVTSLRAAIEAGNLAQHAADRRVLSQHGPLAPIDAVQTAITDGVRELCLERFQDAAAHLKMIDVSDVPAELHRELEGYRALAALGRQDIGAARAHARNAVEAVAGGWRGTSDRRALRRARLLAGFVFRSVGSIARADRILCAVDLIESPDGPIAWAIRSGKLADHVRRSGIARAMHATSKNAGAFSFLPPRQLEIARLLMSGQRTAQIAENLGVSAATIKTQLQRLYRRLNVQKRADALRILAGGQKVARLL